MIYMTLTLIYLLLLSYFFWSRFYIVILGMTFFSFSNLLFPILIWTIRWKLFISLFLFGLLFPFSLWTFIFPFLFGLLFLFWTFISLLAKIAIWSWISSKFFPWDDWVKSISKQSAAEARMSGLKLDEIWKSKFMMTHS